MNTNAHLAVFTVFLAGCQAAPPPPSTPASTLPVFVPPLAAPVRTPEVVKTYTIGAYVDPDDPTLRHEAHTVQRIEAVANWDLRPVAEVKSTPSVMVQTEQPSARPAVPPPVAPTVVATPPAIELSIDPEPALMPNADGVIDLSSVVAPASSEVNPFAVRAAPAQTPREIELRITGIMAGAKPGAIINGQLLEPGAVVEGLTLARIEPGAVILTLGRHRLRAPLSAEPIRVRTTP
jgi:hypothetical protein